MKFKALPSPMLLKIIQSFLGLTGSVLEFLNTVFQVLVFGAESLYLFSRRLKCTLHIFVLFQQKLLAFTKLSHFYDSSVRALLLLSRVFMTVLSFPANSFTSCLVATADVLRVSTAIINSITDNTLYQI